MFKFNSGAKMEKIRSVDPAQLSLHKDFDAVDIGAELYTPESIKEDREREEKMIQETLTRRVWEKEMKEKANLNLVDGSDYENYLDWEAKNGERVVAEFKKAKAEKNPPVAIGSDLEDFKPGDELYGRFAKYKSKGRK